MLDEASRLLNRLYNEGRVHQDASNPDRFDVDASDEEHALLNKAAKVLERHTY